MFTYSAQDLEASIIFEDSRFIFINKPAGLAVHGVISQEGAPDSLGVIELLRQSRPDAPYLELAHRLDKPTSGVLVVAKRKSALRAFQKQQENRGVDKHYVALVKGVWQGSHRKVDAPLFKVKHKDGSWSVKVDKNKGKRAVSYFSPVETHKDSSLVRIKIITGRTHQIRVHAAFIGFPIVGDDKYGDAVFSQVALANSINRLCLHAESIKFSLPDIAAYDIQAVWRGLSVVLPQTRLPTI
ncbi:MAG: RluA family pseudouridine synthase [Ghiorsea sp.]|nr:RluA family pseudouridine synthase [Ghiorsea sp.]